MNYTKSNEEEILNWLKANLSEHRYLHSTGCAKSAVELAKKFGLDEKKAYIAGLLHDCAKNLTKEDTIDIIKGHLPDVGECELANYKTLHAPVSAYLARKEFGIDDEEILSAIRWHTLGKLNMTDFEKIIFLADKIEPHTRDLEYRKLVLSILEEKNELDDALLVCFKGTIQSLVRRDMEICHITIDVYNQLQRRRLEGRL